MTALQQRIKKAVDDVCMGETSIGEALRTHFPETKSGDVAPDWEEPIRSVLEIAFREWVEWNVPGGAE